MSSLRNAIPQRPYRERAQPHARRRQGLLEKHKDYSARARDYNEKKARLRILRQKASERNEDEFHFGMMSSKSKDGVKIADRGNKALSNEVVKLLKTQDAGYLRTMRSRTRRERERLESQVQIIDAKPGEDARVRALKDGRAQAQQGLHTVFVDNESEQNGFTAEDWFQTDGQGLHQTYNRPRQVNEKPDESALDGSNGEARRAKRETKPDADEDTNRRAAQKQTERSQEQLKAKLEALQTREEELLAAEQELDRQRAKMNNTLGGTNKHGVKFKVRERKR